MTQDLIKLREQVMDRVERAIDAAWPARTGDDYVQEMRRAAGELETIAGKMQKGGFDRIEQSRTYRYLGSVQADLEPALGKATLYKAKQAYQAAEGLLKGQSDELEQAKLNFNFANTLRLIDPNDIAQLQEAKQRLSAAREYFAEHDPKYMPQVDAAYQSVESLLRIAPFANAVKQNTADMAALQKQLVAGGNVSEIAGKAHEVMKRGGGVPGMVGQLQTIVDMLSDDQRQSEKFRSIQKQMQDLTKRALGSNEMTPEVKQIWSMLNDRLTSEADGGKVPKDRSQSLRDVLEEFGRILSGGEEDVHALLDKLQRMREFIEDRFEMAHYPSYGIERPPKGSRAAELVELNWQLRRHLMEEMARPEKGEEESKEALDLSVQATKVDQHIYEAGVDNSRAMTVEKDELRPLALSIRNFSARMNTMLARPAWRFANVSPDTNAVFFSGAEIGKPSTAAACQHLGLEIMAAPCGESPAGARWKQLQKAITAVFDFRVTDGPDMAAATYELGIALTLGRPVVILVGKGQTIPFDVDIEPVILAGGPEDNAAVASAIDRSVVRTYPRPRLDASPITLEYVISRFPPPQQNVYVNQTLRMLSDLRIAPDPLAISRTLVKFIDYLNDGKTMLIHPSWSPIYPEAHKPRLFHVMPFRPDWADNVKAVTRKVCEAASVKYVRGDEVAEPNVIGSIWEEIGRATHILVDLTGCNPNVALELGIVHTLGKNVLLTGQGDPKANIFRSISKFRVQSYSIRSLAETLGKEVRKFLLPN